MWFCRMAGRNVKFRVKTKKNNLVNVVDVILRKGSKTQTATETQRFEAAGREVKKNEFL